MTNIRNLVYYKIEVQKKIYKKFSILVIANAIRFFSFHYDNNVYCIVTKKCMS